MKKHYLIYGHGGAYNHGGEAITRCTVEYLRKITPECFITLSTHFPEQDLEFDISVDEIVSRNLNGKTNEEVYRATLEKVTPNTTAIQVGGDNYCYANWQRYAQIHEATKRCGGKSILWGCSIDEEQITEEMLSVLSGHDLILARENITYRILRKNGLNNVLQVSDIAFSMQPQFVGGVPENYVVVNLSPLVCRKNPLVYKAAKRVIEFVVNETEYKVVLLPHVVMPADNDYEVLSTLVSEASKRIVLISDKLSAKQYKYIVSRATFCMAARTHVTIAAYSSGVPTLAIGYSTKARGIAGDLGLSDYVIDIFDKNIEDVLIAKFMSLLSEGELIRKSLEGQMDEYKKRICNKELINFLKGEIV